jgi:CHAD domain-containing protein
MAKEQHASSSNGGGKKEVLKRLLEAPVPTPALTPAEQEELRSLDRLILERKASVSDLVMSFEQEKLQRLQAVQHASNAYMERAKALLQSRGVNLESPNERWNLDTTKMVFNRLK